VDFELFVDLPDEIRLSGAIEIREKFGTISGGDEDPIGL